MKSYIKTYSDKIALATGISGSGSSGTGANSSGTFGTPGSGSANGGGNSIYGSGSLHTPTTFSDLVTNIISLINLAVPLLLALALLFFMWSCVQYITKAGEGGGEARTNILWGIIALFVILSIWGLINVLCVTFLGGSCK